MYKIMIADDEPIVLDSLKTFPWSDHQCCVTCFAENGLNALHTLESEKVDILISDIRMPGMNGLELSKAVKERFPETEIILLTGYAEFEYAKQALSLGIRQYLLKPFRFEDIESALLSCIHSLDNLESRRRQQTYIQEKLQLIHGDFCHTGSFLLCLQETPPLVRAGFPSLSGIVIRRLHRWRPECPPGR